MLHHRSFAQLRQMYRSGELSPADVARSALAHGQRVQAATNAFALLDEHRALVAATASERRWRAGKPASDLDGMPLTVKDFAAVEGWPTRRGSLTTSGAPAAESTVFVERLQQAGAVLLGKTRAPEFNWKGVTDSPGFGETRNPWNLDLTPGGSSGGCAAAVASGTVRVSFGSDAGGSVRIPAAFSGTIGLKPTYGFIPMAPLPSHFSGMAHIGPLGASTADVIDAMRIVAGSSPRDWTSGGSAACLGELPEDAMNGLKIGLLAPRRWADADAATGRAIDRVLGALRAGGIAIREIDFDIHGASAIGRRLYEIACREIVRGIPEPQHHLLDPGLVACARTTGDVDLPGYFALMHQRNQFGHALAALFEQIDVMLLPTVPIAAFAVGRDVPPGWPDQNWLSWNPYTPAFNALQAPALSFPVWPDGDLPIGVQLVARAFDDGRLLRLGAWLEARLPFRSSPLAR